jgi:hypothetical protein
MAIEIAKPSTVQVDSRTYSILASNEHLAVLLRQLADELLEEDENRTLLSLFVGCDPDKEMGWLIDVVMESHEPHE